MSVLFRSAITLGRVFRNVKPAFASTQIVRNSSGYRPDPDFKHAHLDEMPVPQGSWLEHYNKKQAAYNRQFFTGLILLVGTVAYICISDEFFFNAFPPPLDEETIAKAPQAEED